MGQKVTSFLTIRLRVYWYDNIFPSIEIQIITNKQARLPTRSNSWS